MSISIILLVMMIISSVHLMGLVLTAFDMRLEHAYFFSAHNAIVNDLRPTSEVRV